MVELKIDQDFYAVFKKLLVALKDYNKDIVIIGGLANALYEYHPKGQASGLGDLATKDLDVLTSEKVTIINDKITDCLKDEGFDVDYKSVENKAATIFTLPEQNFEIEFLCPMFGSDPDRLGEKQLVTEVQEGVNAQPLRYLDLALFDPWILHTADIPELRDIDMEIQIPNPAAYLIQKFIIQDKRAMNNPSFAQKDCFYIYELLLKFRDHLEVIKECTDNLIVMNASKGKYNKVKNFKRDFRKHFESGSSVGVIRVHEELRDRGHHDIELDDIVAMFEMFLDVI